MKPLTEIILASHDTEPLPSEPLHTEPTNSVDLSIAGRGRLLAIHDVEAVFFGRRSPKWIKANICPDKRILIGDLWCIWESDLRDYLDAQRGLPSPKRRAHLLRNSPMRSLINDSLDRINKERARSRRSAV